MARKRRRRSSPRRRGGIARGFVTPNMLHATAGTVGGMVAAPMLLRALGGNVAFLQTPIGSAVGKAAVGVIGSRVLRRMSPAAAGGFAAGALASIAFDFFPQLGGGAAGVSGFLPPGPIRGFLPASNMAGPSTWAGAMSPLRYAG